MREAGVTGSASVRERAGMATTGPRGGGPPSMQACDGPFVPGAAEQGEKERPLPQICSSTR